MGLDFTTLDFSGADLSDMLEVPREHCKRDMLGRAVLAPKYELYTRMECLREVARLLPPTVSAAGEGWWFTRFQKFVQYGTDKSID